MTGNPSSVFPIIRVLTGISRVITFGMYDGKERLRMPKILLSPIFLLTGLRIYTGEYKAQGPTLCPTEGRALRGPRALYSPV